MIWTQMIPDHLDLRQLTAFISSYCFLLYKSIQRSLKIDLLKLHMSKASRMTLNSPLSAFT